MTNEEAHSDTIDSTLAERRKIETTVYQPAEDSALLLTQFMNRVEDAFLKLEPALDGSQPQLQRTLMQSQRSLRVI
jgi:hypothetical protein